MDSNANRVPQLVEVAARDGLQSETRILPTVDKVELCRRAIGAGLRRIEVASFVRPDLVPQLADGAEVVAGLRRWLTGQPAGLRGDTKLIGLVLNSAGLDRALAAGVDEINLVTAATDEFSRRNQGRPLAEVLAGLPELAGRAKTAGRPVSLTVSTAFGCPFAGEVDLDRLRPVLRAVLAAEPDEVVLADTIGAAVPNQVRAALTELRRLSGSLPIGFHAHNSRNTGYANALAAAELGVNRLDSALGGLGGCPFAPGASGNIATEDLAHLLIRSGWQLPVDLEELIAGGRWLGDLFDHPLSAQLGQAGVFPPRIRKAEP